MNKSSKNNSMYLHPPETTPPKQPYQNNKLNQQHSQVKYYPIESKRKHAITQQKSPTPDTIQYTQIQPNNLSKSYVHSYHHNSSMQTFSNNVKERESKHNVQNLLSKNQYQNLQREVEALRKTNDQFKDRQNVYIEKLMRLEEGLEKQYEEFVKLQTLYTELFESYKHKELEIAQLEMHFRESQRYKKGQTHHHSKNQQGNNVVEQQSEKKQDPSKIAIIKQQSSPNKKYQERQHESIQHWLHKEKQYTQIITELSNKVSSLAQIIEKYELDLEYYRNKSHMIAYSSENSKKIEEKIFEEINILEQQLAEERQIKIKLQYENQFLKNRNEDLEKTRVDLESMLSHKQKQIGKLRQQKINIHRNVVEKLNSSNRLTNRQSTSRSRSFEKKAGSKSPGKNMNQLISIKNNQELDSHVEESRASQHNYQKFHNNVPDESISYHNTNQHNSSNNDEEYFPKHMQQNSSHNGSVNASNIRVNASNVRVSQSNVQESQKSKSKYNNNNGYGNHNNEQYFSFSKSKYGQSSVEEELPTFPPELEIDSIISGHQNK